MRNYEKEHADALAEQATDEEFWLGILLLISMNDE